MKKLKIFTFSILTLVILIFLLIQIPYVKKTIYPTELYISQDVNKKFNQEWDEIYKNHEKIKDLEMFKITKKNNGAEYFKKKLNNQNGYLHFRLDDNLRNKIKNHSVKINWDDYSELFKFFDDIHSFDYLNFYESQSVSEINGENILIPSPKIPLFGTKDFVTLRLLMGVDENKLEESIKDVRHLAKLLFSLEDDVLSVLGIALLGSDRSFRSKYPEQSKNIKLPEISEDITKAARSFFIKTGLLTDIRLNDNLYEKGLSLKAGNCTSLNYNSRRAAFGKNYFESKYKKNYERLKKTIQEYQETCFMDVGKKFILEKNNLPEFKTASYFNDNYDRIIAIPLLKIFALFQEDKFSDQISFGVLNGYDQNI